jgi:TRAP-type uncharacterized transport system fused permease subunit
MTSIILGMEVPTTAAYIVAVVIGGPALIELGIPPIAAHLFVFYLAILSAVTPPVCGAIFIAAGMAEADWIETAKIALKLSFAAFLLPFLFVYDPRLILIGSPLMILVTLTRAAVSLSFLSAGFMGYFRYHLTATGRIVMIGAGVLMLAPGVWSNLVGVLLGGFFLFIHIPEKRKRNSGV